MVILKSKKHVFWEALLVTVLIFGFGILLGIAFESTRINNFNDYYTSSEISLMDIVVFNSMIDSGSSSCEIIIKSELAFADKIYLEAKKLESFESIGRLSNSLWLLHKKYDLLRTLLWVSSTKISEKCPKSINSVVYLYEFNPKDLTQKATQSVWGKILSDLKNEHGKKVLLIPIAVDSALGSLDSIVSSFNITSYPVVIINNEHFFSKLESVKEIEKYLK